jgi:hypothetical protein
VCLAVILGAEWVNLSHPIYWLAAIFGVNSIIFLALAVITPGTTISIDGTGICRSGKILGGALQFAEISSAVVERDPDAQNHIQIVMRTPSGQSLLIDPRFLNPDSDGLVDLLRERLQQHGMELVWESAIAEQFAGGRSATRPELKSPS